MEQQKERIALWMAICMATTALFIDGFNALLNLLAIGEVLSSVISPVATFGFVVWFWLLDVTFIKNPGKLAAMGGQALIGLVPVLNTLPELTIGVIITIILTHSEDKGGLLGKVANVAKNPITNPTPKG